MRGRKVRASGLLPLLLALSACPSLPELDWQGEHIRFGTDEPANVCAGTLEYLDKRTGQLQSRLNTNQKIDYYWLPNRVEDFCPKYDDIVGCVIDTEVFSAWVPHEHEVAHAVISGFPRVLNEGLATHWGDPWPIYQMAPRERLHELLVEDAEIDGPNDYARAAHFMAFLSETYGRETLTELNKALGADASDADIDRVFGDIYGSALSEVLIDYDDYADCDGFVDVSLSCMKEPILIGFGSPEIAREIDCSSPQTIGPYEDMAFVEEVIELQPSVSGSRVLQVTGDGVSKGGVMMIRRCGPCSENGVGAGNALSFLGDEDLPAGRYLLRFYLPVEHAPATLGLQISG